MNPDELKQIAVLQAMDSDALARLAAALEEKEYADGQNVFADGDPGDSMYFIAKGRIRVMKRAQTIGALHKTLAVLETGDYFGEMALIDNFPRSATAVTNDDADVFSISKPDLDRVLIADRDLGYKLLWTFTRTLSRRLRETNDKLTGFLALSGGF